MSLSEVAGSRLPIIPEVPLAYAAPLLDFGAFHVSQAAHDAYGLRPLIPVIQQPDLMPSQSRALTPTKNRPRFDILLMGPKEPDENVIAQRGEEWRYLPQLIRVAGHGVSVVVRSSETKDQVARSIIDQAVDREIATSDEEGQSREEIAASIIHIITGMSLRYSAAEIAPNVILNELLDQIVGAVGGGTTEWFRWYEGRMTLRYVQTLGGVMAASTMGEIGLLAADGGHDLLTGALSGIMTGAFLFSLIKANSVISHHINHADAREASIADTATRNGENVATRIYEIYSPQLFDERFTKNLKGQPE